MKEMIENVKDKQKGEEEEMIQPIDVQDRHTSLPLVHGWMSSNQLTAAYSAGSSLTPLGGALFTWMSSFSRILHN